MITNALELIRSSAEPQPDQRDQSVFLTLCRAFPHKRVLRIQGTAVAVESVYFTDGTSALRVYMPDHVQYTVRDLTYKQADKPPVRVVQVLRIGGLPSRIPTIPGSTPLRLMLTKIFDAIMRDWRSTHVSAAAEPLTPATAIAELIYKFRQEPEQAMRHPMHVHDRDVFFARCESPIHPRVVMGISNTEKTKFYVFVLASLPIGYILRFYGRCVPELMRRCVEKSIERAIARGNLDATRTLSAKALMTKAVSIGIRHINHVETQEAQEAQVQAAAEPPTHMPDEEKQLRWERLLDFFETERKVRVGDRVFRAKMLPRKYAGAKWMIQVWLDGNIDRSVDYILDYRRNPKDGLKILATYDSRLNKAPHYDFGPLFRPMDLSNALASPQSFIGSAIAMVDRIPNHKFAFSPEPVTAATEPRPKNHGHVLGALESLLGAFAHGKTLATIKGFRVEAQAHDGGLLVIAAVSPDHRTVYSMQAGEVYDVTPDGKPAPGVEVEVFTASGRGVLHRMPDHMSSSQLLRKMLQLLSDQIPAQAQAAAEPHSFGLVNIADALMRMRGVPYMRSKNQTHKTLEATIASVGTDHTKGRQRFALVSDVWQLDDGKRSDRGSFPVHVYLDDGELVVLAEPGRVPPVEIGRSSLMSAAVAARWILRCVAKYNPLKDWQ